MDDTTMRASFTARNWNLLRRTAERWDAPTNPASMADPALVVLSVDNGIASISMDGGPPGEEVHVRSESVPCETPNDAPWKVGLRRFFFRAMKPKRDDVDLVVEGDVVKVDVEGVESVADRMPDGTVDFRSRWKDEEFKVVCSMTDVEVGASVMKAARFMGSTDHRSFLNGVSLVRSDGALNVVGCDGFTMFGRRFQSEGPDLRVVIPRSIVRCLHARHLTFALSDSRWLLESACDGFTALFPRPPARPPMFVDLLDSDENDAFEMNLSRDALIGGLAPFERKPDGSPVTLRPTGKGLRVEGLLGPKPKGRSAVDDRAPHSFEVGSVSRSGDPEGATPEVHINPCYLERALKTFDVCDVTIGFPKTADDSQANLTVKPSNVPGSKVLIAFVRFP